MNPLQRNNPYTSFSLTTIRNLREPLQDALDAYADVYPSVDDRYDILVAELNKIDYAASVAIATNNFENGFDIAYIGKSVVELTSLRQPIEDALHAYPYPSKEEAEPLLSKLNQIDYAESIAKLTNNFGV